jgi:hypothetical protein
MSQQKDWLNKLASLAAPPQWTSFEAMLSYNIGLHQSKLEQATEPADIYRAQGAIQALKALRYLRDEIQNGNR